MNPENIVNTVVKRSRGRPAIYPWASLNVGEGFFAPSPNSVIAGAYSYGKRHNMSFKSAKVEENGQMGVRIQRIA